MSCACFSVAGVGADQGMDEQMEWNAEHPEGLSPSVRIASYFYHLIHWASVFWRVCWTGRNSGSEEGGNRSDSGLRAASSHRDWWWSPQHRHHSLSFKGNEHPPVFITVNGGGEDEDAATAKWICFVYVMLLILCVSSVLYKLTGFVCACRREGHTLAVMMPQMNRTSVSLLTELSHYMFNYCSIQSQ